jgi:hypothetical protein
MGDIRSTLVHRFRRDCVHQIFKNDDSDSEDEDEGNKIAGRQKMTTNKSNSIVKEITKKRKDSKILAHLLGAKFDKDGSIERYDLRAPLLYPEPTEDDVITSAAFRVGKLFRNRTLMKVLSFFLHSLTSMSDYHGAALRSHEAHCLALARLMAISALTPMEPIGVFCLQHRRSLPFVLLL